MVVLADGTRNRRVTGYSCYWRIRLVTIEALVRTHARLNVVRPSLIAPRLAGECRVSQDLPWPSCGVFAGAASDRESYENSEKTI